MPYKKLTERQFRFVHYYHATGNASQAAKMAGYAHPNVEGAKLLLNPRLQEQLALVRKNHQEQAGITREAKKARLKQIIETGEDNVACKAADIDNKMEGEYIQRVEIWQGRSKDELNHASAEEMRKDGWLCIPPGQWEDGQARLLSGSTDTDQGDLSEDTDD